MDIYAIVSWFSEHGKDLWLVYASLVTAASIIVRLTPTLKDDEFLLKITKFVAKYIALNTNAPTSRPQ